jgi:hypothetical protein
MDEALVGELEAAIADVGALVVRAQKYSRGAGTEGAALLGEALGLGDQARRLHRHGRLDDPAATRLLAEARALGGRLAALVAAVHAAPAYAAACAAYAAGDHAELLRLLPSIFAGLVATPAPPLLYHPLAWRRRGRIRPAAEVVAEARLVQDEGLPPDGDDLSPGRDATLPAVVLLEAPPTDGPVALRLAGAGMPPTLLRLAETGEYLIHTVRLHAPLAVRVATDLEQVDDEAAAEGLDWPRYRDDLTARLGAAGVALVDDEAAPQRSRPEPGP